MKLIPCRLKKHLDESGLVTANQWVCFGTQKGEIPKLEQKEDLEISVQFNLKFQDKLLLLLLESDTNIWQAFFL